MVDAQCKLMLDAYACLPNPVIHVTTVDQTVKLVYPYCYLFFGGGSGWVEPRRKKMLYNPLTLFSKSWVNSHPSIKFRRAILG